MRTAVPGVLVVLVSASAAEAGEQRPAGGVSALDDAGSAVQVERLILDEASYWRGFWTWRTPLVRKDGELAAKDGRKSGYISSWEAESPFPPRGWEQPDFDDSTWGRWPGPLRRILRSDRRRRYHGLQLDYGFAGGYGSAGGPSPCLALLCLRGRFRVTNPAGARLKLSLAYRGGIVVYLNGREIARGHLPGKGPVAPEALAEDYPPEAFLLPRPWRGSLCIRSEFGHPTRYRDRLEKRIRRLTDIEVPTSLLRRGTNILALEIHRAPYYGDGLRRENLNHRSVWSTCGLVRCLLRGGEGVEPNCSRPPGLQVWNASTLTRLTAADYGDPLEPLRPITIVGVRNGVFTGKVVVSSDAPLRGVRAAMGDLKHEKGRAGIPSSAVEVLYTIRDDRMALRYRTPVGFWDTLLEAPPDVVEPAGAGPKGQTFGAILPIWIRVKVPGDAAAGRYRGTLTIRAGGHTCSVPVHLKVIDWRLPDPKDYLTHTSLVQSPESVALQYGVPLWSEEHWRLMERSFRFLGEVGNKYVVLPLICHTNFGNSQSMVRWIREPGGGWRHDFSVFDRYLDLALKYTRPDVVVLYCWDLYCGRLEWGRRRVAGTRGPLVTVLDPRTGEVQTCEGPPFDSPQARPFWAPVFEEIRHRLHKRGLLGKTMVGIYGENRYPTPEPVKLFASLLPGSKAVFNGHPDWRGRSIHGVPIGYNTAVYVNLFPPPGKAPRRRSDGGYYYGWRTRSDIFPRSGGPATRQPLYHSSTLALHRVISEAAFLANFSGLGRTGADFWPVLKKRGRGQRSRTITARFPESNWRQLSMDTATEALLAPGPEGAVSTERFEMLREGVQECEARAFIEKALLSGRLDPDLAARCRRVLDQRAWLIRSGCLGSWTWYEEQAPTTLAERLFTCAAEVAEGLGGGGR